MAEDKKLNSKYARASLFDTLGRRILRHVPSRLFRISRGVIFRKDITIKESAKTPGLSGNLEMRLPADDEREACRELSGLPLAEFDRRLEAGNHCLIVFQDNRPLNINWIHYGPAYIRGFSYLHKARDNEAYVYGIRTAPSQRGKGIYKRALVDMEKFIIDQKKKAIIQLVESGNIPVFKTLPKLGYYEESELYHLTICGIKFTRQKYLSNKRCHIKISIRQPENVFII